MYVKNFLKHTVLILVMLQREGLTCDNHNLFKNILPKTLAVLSHPVIKNIPDNNMLQIERIDVERDEHGYQYVHRYKPCALYGINLTQNQVKNISLVYSDKFFLDKEITKNGNQNPDGGHFSLNFPKNDLCYKHTFQYQEELDHCIQILDTPEPEFFVNTKPDIYYHNNCNRATFYPFGGFYSSSKPIDEWQQSYFSVLRRDRKHTPAYLDFLLDVVPVPLKGDAIINTDRYSREVFVKPLRSCQYKSVKLVATDIFRYDEHFERVTDHPEIWLPSDGIVYELPFDCILEDIDLNTNEASPIWALGGFYQAGCALDKIRQHFIRFSVQNEEINHRVSPLEEWWERGSRPPQNLPEGSRLANARLEVPYLSLENALRQGEAMVSLEDGYDSNGEAILKTYHSIDAVLYGSKKVLVTFVWEPSKKIQSKSDSESDMESDFVSDFESDFDSSIESDSKKLLPKRNSKPDSKKFIEESNELDSDSDSRNPVSKSIKRPEKHKQPIKSKDKNLESSEEDSGSSEENSISPNENPESINDATIIDVITHNEFIRKGISPYQHNTPSELLLWGRKHTITFDPPATLSNNSTISKALQNGYAVVTLTYKNENVVLVQSYKSSGYRHPWENGTPNFNELYVYYTPIKNSFHIYQSHIDRKLDSDSYGEIDTQQWASNLKHEILKQHNGATPESAGRLAQGIISQYEKNRREGMNHEQALRATQEEIVWSYDRFNNKAPQNPHADGVQPVALPIAAVPVMGAIALVGAIGAAYNDMMNNPKGARKNNSPYVNAPPHRMDAAPQGRGNDFRDKGFDIHVPGPQIHSTPIADSLPALRGYEAAPQEFLYGVPEGFFKVDFPENFILENLGIGENRQLLQGEGRVGKYGRLKKLDVPGDNLAAHHIPHDQYMKNWGIKRNDGIALAVEDPFPGAGGRHREIHKHLKKQDINLKPRDALAQGINRAKEVYRQDGLYMEIRLALLEVIKQNKEVHKDLFQKK